MLCNTCGFQHAFFWVSVYFVGYSHSPGAWGGLWFSCGVAHCGGSSISVFRETTGAGGIPISGWAWRRAIAVWGFEVFLIFPNFPRSSLLGRSATGIYQFITNNDASFHLWWKENLLNYQKVSKYYEYTCRFVWCFFVSVKTGFILIIS